MSSAAARSAGIETGFINKTLMHGDEEIPYVVYVPRDYDPGQSWPVILFLHGAGERGVDGLVQTEVGIGRAIRRYPDRFPCLVVMPQCPPDVWWDRAIDRAEMSLAQTLAEYSTDPDRIYLTGLSMGGFGTWLLGAAQADRFAALMPICGGGQVEDAAALARLPIWAFHGDADSVVPPEQSRVMVKAVQAAGGAITYTEYEGVDHNSWDPAYSDEAAIAWLLQQRRTP